MGTWRHTDVSKADVFSRKAMLPKPFQNLIMMATSKYKPAYRYVLLRIDGDIFDAGE